MRAILRGTVALTLALGGMWVAASPAVAADRQESCDGGEGYVPPGGCEVKADVSAVCSDAGAGQLVYGLTSPGGATTTTIILKDSDGTSATLTNQPMNGTTAWPASVDAAKTTVTFITDSKPEYTATVSVTTPVCVLKASTPTPTPTSTSTSQVLAATGAQAAPLAGIAAGLVMVGGAIYLVARRRSA